MMNGVKQRLPITVQIFTRWMVQITTSCEYFLWTPPEYTKIGLKKLIRIKKDAIFAYLFTQRATTKAKMQGPF